MASGMQVTRLEARSHEQPGEVRSPSKTRVEVIRLTDYTMGRFIFQPGWRWSECVKPVAKTESCQAGHVGYCVAGSMTVQMTDGLQMKIGPGMSYTIPPGHDAWVDGKDAFVGLEMMSAEIYAKG